MTNNMFRIFFLFFFVVFCLPPRFPARTHPEYFAANTTTSETIHVTKTTWRNFSRLVDVQKGTQVTGVSELKRYFHRFGYLTVGFSKFSDVFDTDLESAIFLYQKNLGLPVTGKLDAGTVELIMSPRCGVSDSHMTSGEKPNGVHATKRYAYFSGKPRWNRDSPLTLTYAFSKANMIDYLNADDVKGAFRRAFYRWAKVIPVSFQELEDYSSADIKIGFYHKDHGDGQLFDGVLGILAHAFAPESGNFHLDAAETWAVDFRKTGSTVAVDLESVATHEIGHVMGLGHSSVKGAVMYPSLGARTKKVELTVDDVEGVQELYGSNPNFSLSSLLESENSSNKSEGTMRCSPGGFAVSLLFLLVLLGDAVNCLQRASIIPGGSECIIYGTVMGSLGALHGFTSRDDVQFSSHLEMHLTQEHPPLCGRDHMAYGSAYFSVKDVIDGDLCEQFPTLSMDLQRKIRDELDITPAAALKKLDDVRNKII